MVADRFVQALVNTCIGRFDRYLVQRSDGKYAPVFDHLTYDVLRDHLGGFCTLASYVITEKNLCRFAVFDSDDRGGVDGFLQLWDLQQTLATFQVPSYLEQSRRGAHLWVFFQELMSPALVRRALLPFCPPDVEFFPAQDCASFEHPGYAVRVPLGVHRKSGQTYPFVEYWQGSFVSCVSSDVRETLLWLSSVARASLETIFSLAQFHTERVVPPEVVQERSRSPVRTVRGARWASIADWRAEQDPIALIGRYVELDSRGMGRCPFSWHHSDGVDTHPSFWVYRPRVPGGCCWYCHAWKQGGSVFDFLLFWYGFETRELWHRILDGEQF